MRRATTSTTMDRVGMTLSRATVQKSNVKPKLQEIDVKLFADEESTGVEHLYPYGFAARVKGPTKDDQGRTKAAEVVVLSAGGNRSHPVALPASDRRFPPPVELQEGESVFYDHQGQYLHFGTDGMTLKTSKSLTLKLGSVEFRFSSVGLEVTGGTITHNGKKIDATHKHGGVQSGGSLTDVPQG